MTDKKDRICKDIKAPILDIYQVIESKDYIKYVENNSKSLESSLKKQKIDSMGFNKILRNTKD